MLETDRPIALREAIMACRNGGTVSVIGVYGGFIDKFPMGAVMNRSLTIKTGQCHVQRYMRPLLERIQRRRDRSELRHHAPHAARRCAARVRDVREQAGRLHEGGAEELIGASQVTPGSPSGRHSAGAFWGSGVANQAGGGRNHDSPIAEGCRKCALRPPGSSARQLCPKSRRVVGTGGLIE